LKTHDFHILLQQVLLICLRTIGNLRVLGAIMRVCKVFRKICAKVVDLEKKVQMMEDVPENICTLDKKTPPINFCSNDAFAHPLGGGTFSLWSSTQLVDVSIRVLHESFEKVC